MKKIGTYTARGTFLESTAEFKIQLFDGSFETAYRVTDFVIWAANASSSSNDCCARLSTEALGPMPSSGALMMRADDNRQIAWGGIQAGSSGFNNPAQIIDPDNLIIQDLFISGQSGGSSIEINYLITMDKYEISDWEGAFAMVRDSAQNVGGSGST